MPTPAMSARHFALIAEALRGCKPHDLEPLATGHWAHTCHYMSAALAGIDPKFNRSKFIEACGAMGWQLAEPQAPGETP